LSPDSEPSNTDSSSKVLPASAASITRLTCSVGNATLASRRSFQHLRLDIKSTYVDYQHMPRKPNNSRQTRALLAALLDRSQTWRHGYDLSKETGLRSGTLYPLLMRLSEQGLLESRWQETERPGLPPRHVYRLTASGRSLARDQELAAIAAERAGALA